MGRLAVIDLNCLGGGIGIPLQFGGNLGYNFGGGGNAGGGGSSPTNPTNPTNPNTPPPACRVAWYRVDVEPCTDCSNNPALVAEAYALVQKDFDDFVSFKLGPNTNTSTTANLTLGPRYTDLYDWIVAENAHDLWKLRSFESVTYETVENPAKNGYLPQVIEAKHIRSGLEGITSIYVANATWAETPDIKPTVLNNLTPNAAINTIVSGEIHAKSLTVDIIKEIRGCKINVGFFGEKLLQIAKPHNHDIKGYK